LSALRTSLALIESILALQVAAHRIDALCQVNETRHNKTTPDTAGQGRTQVGKRV